MAPIEQNPQSGAAAEAPEMGATGEETSSQRHPLLQKGLNYVNPKYHWQQIQHDLASMKEAMANRSAVLDGSASVPLDRVFRGKLFGAFFISGPTNLIGVGLGYGLQRQFHSQWVGLFGTILVCFFVTALAYQLIWWIDNRALYRQAFDNPVKRFVERQKDLAPVHRTALQFAVGFGLVTIPINAVIVGIITLVNDQFAKILPVGAIIIVVEALFVSGAFVRVMGDFFETYSRKLADKYGDLTGAPTAS